LTTLILFVAVIAVIAAAWRFTGINGVLAFWLAYIMTRPLGASTGDWLSQKGNQGLNLGTSMTSYIFLAVIVFFVAFLQIKKPAPPPPELANPDPTPHPHLPHAPHPHVPHPHLPHPHLPEVNADVQPAPHEA